MGITPKGDSTEVAYQNLPPKDSKLYNTPDGDNLLEKTKMTTYMGLKYGALLAGSEMIFNSHPASMRAVAVRSAQICGPVVMMGATLSLGTALSAYITKRDHASNHAVGGALAGAVLTAATGHRIAGAIVAVGGGFLAYLVKETYQVGPNVIIPWAGEMPPKYQGLPGHHNRTFGTYARRELDVEKYYRN